MNNCTEPHRAEIGQLVAHDLVPGWVMEVQNARECARGDSRQQSHQAYWIIDPTGSCNWLCAYDVHPVSMESWVANTPDLLERLTFGEGER